MTHSDDIQTVVDIFNSCGWKLTRCNVLLQDVINLDIAEAEEPEDQERTERARSKDTITTVDGWSRRTDT